MMLDPRLLGAIAFAGWLCAAIGAYRVIEDADVLGHGLSERLNPTSQVQGRARMLQAFLSPKHKIDRILIVAGALVFFGVIFGMIAGAQLSPPCAEGGVPPLCRASQS